MPIPPMPASCASMARCIRTPASTPRKGAAAGFPVPHRGGARARHLRQCAAHPLAGDDARYGDLSDPARRRPRNHGPGHRHSVAPGAQATPASGTGWR
jgi:hypothetical protein